MKTVTRLFILCVLFCRYGYAQKRVDPIVASLNKQMDTTQFNPRTDRVAINFGPNAPGETDATHQHAAQKFIALADLNTLPASFADADRYYRSFVAQNAQSPYLQAFRQETTARIIRQYLLDHPDKNAALQYYTEEMIAGHSVNYGLLFLCLKQIRPLVGTAGMHNYQHAIHTDPQNLKQREKLDIAKERAQAKVAEKPILQIMIKSVQLKEFKDDFYLHKIDQL